jgi:hypothetical membrane protein
MREIPWWAVLSATLAPVLLIGGWTVAAARQGPDFSSVRDTISALAGRGATDRWLMTTALYGLGLCHLVTPAGLGPAAPAGRILLALGGVATIAVAAFPLPREGTSPPHTAAAWIAFTALAIWPAFAWRSGAPGALQPGIALLGAALLVALALWLGITLFVDQARLGLAERFAAGAQALWPLVVVLTVRLV